MHSLPEMFPEETKRAKFQFLVPKKWWDEKHKPVVFHFAGTGDHVICSYNIIGTFDNNKFHFVKKFLRIFGGED